MNDETNLELLIDSCIKTLATAKGNGHKEYVLYKNNLTNDYEIHYYDLPVGSKDEFHDFRIVDKSVYESLMNLIEEYKLDSYKDVRGFGLCGGDYVCKFKKGDEYIRITTANFNGESFDCLIKIYNAMGGYFVNAATGGIA